MTTDPKFSRLPHDSVGREPRASSRMARAVDTLTNIDQMRSARGRFRPFVTLASSLRKIDHPTPLKTRKGLAGNPFKQSPRLPSDRGSRKADLGGGKESPLFQLKPPSVVMVLESDSQVARELKNLSEHKRRLDQWTSLARAQARRREHSSVRARRPLRHVPAATIAKTVLVKWQQERTPAERQLPAHFRPSDYAHYVMRANALFTKLSATTRWMVGREKMPVQIRNVTAAHTLNAHRQSRRLVETGLSTSTLSPGTSRMSRAPSLRADARFARVSQFVSTLRQTKLAGAIRIALQTASATRAAVKNQSGSNVSHEQLSSQISAREAHFNRRPGVRSRSGGVPSVTINYSPSLVLSEPARTDSDRKLLDILGRHGHEMLEMLQRELKKRARTEF